MRQSGQRWLLLVAAGLACRPAAPREPVAAVVAEPPPADPPGRDATLQVLSRVGVLGASASAGFGTSVPFADALRQAFRVPHEAYDVSSSAHYLRPLDIGRVQVEALKARGVTVVVAVDFLFWFAYGAKPDAQRREELQIGLAMLDEFSVPIFVGDLPDVRGASRRMISRSQIPTEAQLAEFNATIATWAEGREQVFMLPMSRWMHALKMEDAVQLWGHPYEARAGEVLQWDLLHPSTQGQAVLALLVLGEIRDALGGLRDDDVTADPDRVAAALRPAASPSRGLPPPPP